MALGVLRAGDVYSNRTEWGAYSKGHTRMFDILDEEWCLVDQLEDVELKCTRLMSLENIVGGPNLTVDIHSFSFR